MSSTKLPSASEYLSDSKTALMSVHNLGLLIEEEERQGKDSFGDETIADFLENLEFFHSLSQQSLSFLAQNTSEEFFTASSLIVKKGDQGSKMYIIVSGEVRIPIFDASTQQNMIVILGSKQIFGEMALLTGEPRFADVYAKTDCHVLTIKKEDISKLMSEHPEVAGFLTTILGKRLLQVGMQQVGKYKLLGELGRGAMAIVYEGLHPSLQRVVAIKMLSHELVYRSKFREQFRHEARLLARLRHPNIVEVFDTEECYATFFIIMEKITGKDLKEILKERGRIPYEEARKIICQIASALDYAHQHGIIHRDIKPANIIFQQDSGTVKLTDFGIAVEPDIFEKSKDAQSKLQGTPNYMAPEQIMNERLDGRCDIYALGVVAYVMLTGETPYKGPLSKVLYSHAKEPMPSLLKIDPQAPSDLVRFVAKATEKKPEDRFQTGQEIVTFLEAKKPKALASMDLKIKTLTFVYSEESQVQVESLIQKIKEHAEKSDLYLLKE